MGLRDGGRGQQVGKRSHIWQPQARSRIYCSEGEPGQDPRSGVLIALGERGVDLRAAASVWWARQVTEFRRGIKSIGQVQQP